MIKCKKNIFMVFGYLLIVAILFVPYASWSIVDVKKFMTHEVTIRVAIENNTKPPPKAGFMFTPFFIYKQLSNRKEVLDYHLYLITNYKVKYDLLVTDLTIIILVGGFVYILLCVVPRKTKK